MNEKSSSVCSQVNTSFFTLNMYFLFVEYQIARRSCYSEVQYNSLLVSLSTGNTHYFLIRVWCTLNLSCWSVENPRPVDKFELWRLSALWCTCSDAYLVRHHNSLFQSFKELCKYTFPEPWLVDLMAASFMNTTWNRII